MLRSPARSRGLSMVEVMVSVGIIALLLAFAAPSATTWIQNNQVRSAAESVLNGVHTARVEALKRNTFVAFWLTDANSTAWTVCLYDVVNDVCFAAASATLSQKSASEGTTNARVATNTAVSDPAVAMAPGVGVPGRVVFDSFGRLAATAPNNIIRVDVRNNTMLTSSEERRLVILITLNGQVRMCDPKLAKATNQQGCA
jgi:type IV fimbrial biogenesis protein FimT